MSASQSDELRRFRAAQHCYALAADRLTRAEMAERDARRQVVSATKSMRQQDWDDLKRR